MILETVSLRRKTGLKMSEVLKREHSKKTGVRCFFYALPPSGALFFLPSGPYSRVLINNLQLNLYNALDKFQARVYDIRVKEGKAVRA